MAQVLGDTHEHLRRHVGRPADGLPDLGQQRLQQARRRRRWSSKATSCPASSTTTAKPITDYNVFPFPSIGGSAPAVVGGGDSVIMFKDSPAARAFVTYLATPAAATIGPSGRLLVAEQERPAERVHRPAQPRDGARARPGEDVPVRPLRPAAVGVRRDGRAGRVQALPGLPEEPLQRQRHRRAAGGGRGQGLQEVSSMSAGAATAELRPRPPRRAQPGSAAALCRHGCVPCARARPARSVGRLPDRLHGLAELLRPRGRPVRLVRQLQDDLHDRHLDRRSRTTSSGWPSCPRSSPRSG